MERFNQLFSRIGKLIEVRMRQRDASSWLLLSPLVSIVLGLVASGVMMLFLKANPITVYGTMFSYAFRDIYNVADIFAKATPLILTGLAFGFAFRSSLFNIGAQGQFYMGALAAVACSLSLGGLPAVIVLPIALVASALAGGLWAALIGYLKARFNANEFLVSMMLTYVAMAVMNYMVRSPLKEAKGEYPQTDVIPANSWLAHLIPHTRLHWGFLLALVLALVAYIILWKTSLGYRIRVVGSNLDAAKYAGISTKRIFITVFLIAGMFAGIAGFTEVNGMQHMLIQGFNPTIGAEGIGIGILGNAHPLGIVLAAILFGALKVGGNLVVQTSSIPSSIIGIMEGFVMLFVILSYFAENALRAWISKRRLRLRRGEEK